MCRKDTNESTLLENSNESFLRTSDSVIGQYTVLKFGTFKFCLHMSKALKLIHLCRRDTNESTLLEDSNESILLSTSNRVIGQYTFLLKFCTFKFCLHMSTWLSASSNKVTIPKANTQNNNSHHFRCNTPLYLYIPCLLPLLSSLSSKSSLPKPPTIHTTLQYLTLTLSKAD